MFLCEKEFWGQLFWGVLGVVSLSTMTNIVRDVDVSVKQRNVVV